MQWCNTLIYCLNKNFFMVTRKMRRPFLRALCIALVGMLFALNALVYNTENYQGVCGNAHYRIQYAESGILVLRLHAVSLWHSSECWLVWLYQEEADFVAEFLAVGGISFLIKMDAVADDQHNQISILKGIWNLIFNIYEDQTIKTTDMKAWNWKNWMGWNGWWSHVKLYPIFYPSFPCLLKF